MITTCATVRAAPAGPAARITVLAGHEVRRLLRNPVFLVAAGLTAYMLWDRQRAPVAEVNTITVYPALFLGGFGMVATCWLTQSSRRAAAVIDVSPTSPQWRTAAICLVALVPLACGGLSSLAIEAFQRVPGDWAYGALSTSDRVGVLVGQCVLPALGGPLLGVALGRWTRFPGTGMACFLVLYGWVTLTYALTAGHRNSLPILLLRMFAPFTFFTNSDNALDTETWRGSPWCFVGWQLCLCAVAVTVALLRDADGRSRTRLVRVLIAVAAVAAALFTLAAAGGWQHAVITHLGQPPVPAG
jgi:hypothetical protein